MASSFPGLPAGYQARPYTSGDLDAVLELLARSDVAVTGSVEPRRELLTWWLLLPYVDVDRDGLVISDEGGPVGFGFCIRDDESHGAHQSALCRVDPAHENRGLGLALVTWSEQVAAARAAPGEPAFPIRLSCAAGHGAAQELFARRGYVHVRTGWDMGRPLAEAPPPPSPVGIAIRTFVPGLDEHAFWQVNEQAFADDWSFTSVSLETFNAEWWGAGDVDPDHVLLAEVDGAVVGECGWFVIEGRGYVGVLGVLPGSRGRGIATALLLRAFADMRAAGYEQVELSVDSGNETGAVELYRKVGMLVLRQTLVFEKSLGAV